MQSHLSASLLGSVAWSETKAVKCSISKMYRSIKMTVRWTVLVCLRSTSVSYWKPAAPGKNVELWFSRKNRLKLWAKLCLRCVFHILFLSKRNIQSSFSVLSRDKSCFACVITYAIHSIFVFKRQHFVTDLQSFFKQEYFVKKKKRSSSSTKERKEKKETKPGFILTSTGRECAQQKHNTAAGLGSALTPTSCCSF